MTFIVGNEAPIGAKIIFARPFNELIEHIHNDKLPSFRLIARTIKVFVLAIFNWHLCDHIIFPDDNFFSHSIRGRMTVTNKQEFHLEYPYMISNAIFLEFTESPRSEISISDIPKRHKSITAQAVVEAYRNKYGFEISSRTNWNTISALFSSKKLTRIDH